jgi:CubicO group peptidase (beta-lactamase class C family)
MWRFGGLNTLLLQKWIDTLIFNLLTLLKVMRLAFFLPLFLVSSIAVAQSTNRSKADALVSGIVTQFNNGGFAQIYALADSSFKSVVSEDDLVGLLNSAAALGKINNHELLSDADSLFTYRLFFDKKSLLLTLAPVETNVFSGFGLSFYKLPAVRDRKDFLSDNPMKSPLDSAVQNAVTGYMSNKHIAGLSVGVIAGGERHIYNFGETEKGSGRLPASQTLYEIGSVTKTFTGILLAHAVLEGKVRLDDDIRNYLNGKYANLQYGDQPIRVVHLSNHTSGLPSNPRLPDGTDPFDPAIRWNDTLLENILHGVTLDTVPGTRKSYSNLGVGVLGHILENVYGMSYAELLERYITGPFGMQHTGTIVSKRNRRLMAQGYDVEGKETGYWYNKLAEPAGGIHATCYDLLLFMQEQLAETDAASKLSHQLTFGDSKRGTALNWGIYTTKKGYLQWSHDGGTDGFTSLCILYPELGVGIILLTNTGDHDDQSFYDIATAIYLGLIEKP